MLKLTSNKKKHIIYIKFYVERRDIYKNIFDKKDTQPNFPLENVRNHVSRGAYIKIIS